MRMETDNNNYGVSGHLTYEEDDTPSIGQYPNMLLLKSHAGPNSNQYHEDVQSVHSYTGSSHHSVRSSSTRSKRGAKQETKASKFSKKSTSIYRKNRALKQMNEVADNESCSSSVLLAAALDDLAIA